MNKIELIINISGNSTVVEMMKVYLMENTSLSVLEKAGISLFINIYGGKDMDTLTSLR